MALIKCPECGKMISSLASSCPECGCPSEYFLKSDNVSQEETRSKEAYSNHKEVENEDIKSLFTGQNEEDDLEYDVELEDEKTDEEADYYFLEEARLQCFCWDIDRAFLDMISMDVDKKGDILIDIDDSELKSILSDSEVEWPLLLKSIRKTLDSDNQYLDGKVFKLSYWNMENDEESYSYYLIYTIDGIFFFLSGVIAFVKYFSMKNIEKKSGKIRIAADDIQLFDPNGEIFGGEIFGEIFASKVDSLEISLDADKKHINKILYKTLQEVFKVIKKYEDDVIIQK